jgi:acyl-homoserine-lactone acylase
MINRSIYIATVSLLISACGGGNSYSSGQKPIDPVMEDSAFRAEIRRGEYGMVHIKANDYAGIGYGYSYAFAEDNICTIADVYVTVSGERSKYFGPDASWTMTGNGTTNNNLNSDFFFKLINAEQRVENLMAQAPPLGPLPEAQALVKGYVAGYNRYLRDVGVENLPDPSCRGASWVRPITELDVYRRFYQLALLGSSAVAINGIGSAQPPGPNSLSANTSSPEQIAQQLGEAWQGIQIGSNAIALGSEATANGKGMLLGNPHFPWDGAERFHQAHMTIPGTLDTTGSALFGVPMILIGHTQNLAWSHTVSSAWRFTPYQLTLVPGDPTSYLVDGQPEAMLAQELSVELADGTAVSRTLYSTRWGPVLTEILGLPVFPWTPAVAFALADANALNFRYLNHFVETNRAQSVRELLAIMQRNQGIPWVNTIAADSNGEALYADISVTPNVSDQKALECASPLGVATANTLGLPVLDGSRAACAWDNDADAVQAGIIGPDNMPWLIRRDYLTNSNDSYWLSSPEQPLEGFFRIIGDEGTERRMRTRLGLLMTKQRIDGSDGLPGTKFTRQQMQDLIFNNRHMAAELWLDDLLQLCAVTPGMIGAGGPVQTAEACAVLASWTRRDDLDAPGAVLFRRFVANLFISDVPTGTAASGFGFADVWTTPFDVNDPVNTPSGLNIANPHVQYALASAISDLQGNGIPLDASLRTHATESRGEAKIPMHGGPGGYGVFNAMSNTWSNSEAGYNDVVHGASFVQVVSFDGDECPDTQTILTYSQSTNSESPYFADQTQMYSRKEWVAGRFCEAEVAADRRLSSMEISE